MPGRGNYWQKGGLPDDTVTEADLGPTLKGKVNQTGHSIEDEGVPLTDRPDLNFVGAGVTASDDGEKTVITIPGGGGGGYDTIQEEGTPLTQRTTLNFTGAGLTAFDDSENSITQIDLDHDGRFEKIGDTTIGSEVQTIVATLTAVDFSSYSEIVAYAEVGCVSTATTIGWQINGETTGYTQDVFSWNNTAVTAGGNTSAVSFGIAGATAGNPVNSTLRMTELRNGTKAVQIQTNSDTSDPMINYGQLTGTSSNISTITINGLTTNFQSGSRLVVYGIKEN